MSNGEKWAQEYDSAGLSSNISYTHGLVGVGTSVPEYTLDVAGDIRASGNLIVNGSNTLINTTSLAIEDGVIECGKGNSSAAKDLGFLMVRNDGSSTTNSNVAMFWDESTDALTFGFSDSGPTATTLTPNTTKTLNSYFVGNVGVGTATADSRLHIYGTDNPLAFESQRSPHPKMSFDWSGSNAENFTLWDHHSNQRAYLYGRKYTTGTSVNSLAGWSFYGNDNTLALRIDGSAKVGIGTATEDEHLHLLNAAAKAINGTLDGGGIKMERYANYGCAIWNQFVGNTTETCLLYTSPSPRD